jgi:hypothetical protein
VNETILGFAEFVRLVIDAMEAVEIEYLLGGAVATWAWGEPRATQDLDVVLSIPIESVGKLSQELEARDMLVPAEVILDAILDERADLPISAIHMYSGYKADLYPLRGHDDLRKSALDRRLRVDFGPQLGEVFLHTPEDLILYKLWYYSLSEQSKHLRDITSIVLTVEEDLDYDYIESWAERKGVITLWREILERIQN